MDNEVLIIMDAKSQNEAFARMAVAAFLAPLDPAVNDLTDVKTAVSEAVTNAVIHGYENKGGKINMTLKICGDELTVEVIDEGVGMDDVGKAMEPLYTSKPEMERSGMGFTVMQTFMDEVVVESGSNSGTRVCMTKSFGGRKWTEHLNL